VNNFRKFLSIKVMKIVLDSMLYETLKWPQIAPFCISSKKKLQTPLSMLMACTLLSLSYAPARGSHESLTWLLMHYLCSSKREVFFFTFCKQCPGWQPSWISDQHKKNSAHFIRPPQEYCYQVIYGCHLGCLINNKK